MDSRITGLASMQATKPGAKPLTTEPTRPKKTQHVRYILYCDVTAKLLQTSFTILLYTTFLFYFFEWKAKEQVMIACCN